METKEPKLLKVGKTTNSGSLAKCISEVYNKDSVTAIVLRCVGAASLNQAVKSVILANRDFVKSGVIALMLPTFKKFSVDNEPDEFTAIELEVRVKKLTEV